jgi:hypothetical protein
VRAAPTGRKSNILKGSPPSLSRICETMMLGEVPISVMRPPSSEAKDMGMRSAEGEVPFFFASWKATGMSIASAPIFLTKAARTATLEVSAITCRRGVVR